MANKKELERIIELLEDVKQLIVRQNIMIQGVLSKLVKKKGKKG